jgi:hypothetical protein
VPPSSGTSTGTPPTGNGQTYFGRNAGPGNLAGKRLTWIQKR